MVELPDIFAVLSQTSIDPVDYQYFHQLLDNRTIILNREIGEDIIETVYLPLKDFEKDEDIAPVTLMINSVGGSVSDALFLCNVIDNYKKPLNIIVPAYACSMGTIILCAGKNNPNVTKYCYPFSFGLLHCGQTAVSGETTSVEDVMMFNKTIDNQIKQYIIDNTNITEALYNEHHRKQWYLSAEEMKNYGLVDYIIESTNDITSPI